MPSCSQDSSSFGLALPLLSRKLYFGSPRAVTRIIVLRCCPAKFCSLHTRNTLTVVCIIGFHNVIGNMTTLRCIARILSPQTEAELGKSFVLKLGTISSRRFCSSDNTPATCRYKRSMERDHRLKIKDRHQQGWPTEADELHLCGTSSTPTSLHGGTLMSDTHPRLHQRFQLVFGAVSCVSPSSS